MVYEGRGSSRSRRKRRSGAGRGLFKGLLWALVLAVALSVAFPKTAKKVRDKAGDALGVDIGGAMEVFSREAKAKNVFAATREAFRYAFDPTPGGDVEALAGDGEDPTGPSGKGPEGGVTGPTEGQSPGESQVPGESQGPTEGSGSTQPTDPADLSSLPLPGHVTLEKPREKLVLAGPLAGEVVRPFGYAPGETGEAVFHYGIDVRGESGGSVRCVAAGTVTAVGESAIFGKYVIVSHGDGVESLYAMLGETPLTQGETLEAGQAVGALSGETLHLELLIDGDYVDPQHYVYRDEM